LKVVPLEEVILLKRKLRLYLLAMNLEKVENLSCTLFNNNMRTLPFFSPEIFIATLPSQTSLKN